MRFSLTINASSAALAAMTAMLNTIAALILP
jgi:hypothetical protein